MKIILGVLEVLVVPVVLILAIVGCTESMINRKNSSSEAKYMATYRLISLTIDDDEEAHIVVVGANGEYKAVRDLSVGTEAKIFSSDSLALVRRRNKFPYGYDIFIPPTFKIRYMND